MTFDRVGTWGYQSPNGSWGGMIGMLQRGEIDFGGTGTFLMRQRIGVIQYISLSTPTGYTILYIVDSQRECIIHKSRWIFDIFMQETQRTAR